MKYRVKLQKTEEGYAVWCPALPGCWSQGATEEEALLSALTFYALTPHSPLVTTNVPPSLLPNTSGKYIW